MPGWKRLVRIRLRPWRLAFLSRACYHLARLGSHLPIPPPYRMNKSLQHPGGLLPAWLMLLKGKKAEADEQNYLAPDKAVTAPMGDILDSARDCLQELGWTVDDALAGCPSERRVWDYPIQLVLAAHPVAARRAVGLETFRNHLTSTSKQRYCYMGKLMHATGKSLLSDNGLFSSTKVPAWFRVVEEVLKVTQQQRIVSDEWAVSSRQAGGAGSDSSWSAGHGLAQNCQGILSHLYSYSSS